MLLVIRLAPAVAFPLCGLRREASTPHTNRFNPDLSCGYAVGGCRQRSDCLSCTPTPATPGPQLYVGCFDDSCRTTYFGRPAPPFVLSRRLLPRPTPRKRNNADWRRPSVVACTPHDIFSTVYPSRPLLGQSPRTRKSGVSEPFVRSYRCQWCDATMEQYTKTFLYFKQSPMCMERTANRSRGCKGLSGVRECC